MSDFRIDIKYLAFSYHLLILYQIDWIKLVSLASRCFYLTTRCHHFLHTGPLLSKQAKRGLNPSAHMTHKHIFFALNKRNKKIFDENGQENGVCLGGLPPSHKTGAAGNRKRQEWTE